MEEAKGRKDGFLGLVVTNAWTKSCNSDFDSVADMVELTVGSL